MSRFERAPVQFFYIVTIRILNPTGGRERVASASGTISIDPRATEEWKFALVMHDASEELGISHSLRPQDKDVVPYPNLRKYAVLFYLCQEQKS